MPTIEIWENARDERARLYPDGCGGYVIAFDAGGRWGVVTRNAALKLLVSRGYHYIENEQEEQHG